MDRAAWHAIVHRSQRFGHNWGETEETVSDFIFGGSKITADGDCSHEIKIIPWKESYDQPKTAY